MVVKDIALVLALLIAAALALGHWRARRSDPDEAEAERLHDRIWRISESEDRYRALVAATTEVIVQRDARGRITYANDAYAQLLGRPAIDLLGTQIDLEILERSAVEVGEDGVRRMEAQIRSVDGQVRWFAFVEMPVAHGDATHWLRAGRDVTARVEALRSRDAALERAEAASVAKSRFLATVSHEMRTPLNGILGMAELVLGTHLDLEQRTYVEAVRTSGQALLGLIDGVLDFSRIEAGRLDLAAEPFNLPALAESVVELLAPRAQDKGIEIALDVTEDFPRGLIGDADRVRQILINLAGNAIKFTERGGVGVSLSFARMTDGGGEAVLSVSDTGPGIPADRLPILFEEFEQGDGSASRSHEGTGLGLAITRRLVTRMGGGIDADSRVGRGSTFRVVLPLPEAEGAHPSPAPLPGLEGQRCLIVADSPYQAPYLARSLSRAGAATVIVGTLEDGLDALSGAAFDAVLADRALGDAAVRQIADAAHACGVRCSLVLLSPFDRRGFGAPGERGFDGYLIKPVRARSLFERLLAPPVAVEAAPAPVPTPARTGTGQRVLLAEDNPINALLATRALERLGAAVVHAVDGVEALERLESDGPFDLALIDVRMPRLDGHETARRIRAAETAGEGARLHLVALTANAGREDEIAARAAGFDGFLAKPLNLKLLPALLERRTAQAA
ncbi:histidine kinase [Methylobacterium sp. GXS13]|uniref:PAS domain-containing hybrid sensor histidine kinase/response regulator n=1 Tax=Methylobacterium sp. GXS13 TaxID=1730094 RepID=UPI00071B805F|nr:ATP-binding protein [Methylobacterium sp. GXS13]KST60298.1 histidine kinase [Methylobacterium sp. GXS13]